MTTTYRRRETWFELHRPDGPSHRRWTTRADAERARARYTNAIVLEMLIVRRPLGLEWSRTQAWVNGWVLRDGTRTVGVTYEWDGAWEWFTGPSTRRKASTVSLAPTLDAAKLEVEDAVRAGWS